MRAQALVPGIVAVLLVGACNVFGGGPHDACVRAAADYAGTVAGAFGTSVGAVRTLDPSLFEPTRWPDLDADHPAVVCYIDATIAKRPPPGPNGEVRDPFDRVVVGIVDGQAEMINAGYRAHLPVRQP